MKTDEIVNSVARKVNKKILATQKKVFDYVHTNLSMRPTEKEYSDLIQEAVKKYKLQKVYEDSISQGYADVTQKAVSVTISPASKVMLKNWYLENTAKINGERLSSRLWSRTQFKELQDTFSAGLKATESMKTIAAKIHYNGMTRGDVAKDVKRLYSTAREAFALQGEQGAKAYKEYKATAEQVLSRINKLKNPSTSKLKHAYTRLTDETILASDKAFSDAMYYAEYHKAKYNAERLVHTEMSNAYGDAVYSEAMQDDTIAWVQVELSANHPEDDICNFYAEADLYGKGAGWYPKDEVPDFPFHPNCLCVLVPLAGLEETSQGKTMSDSKAQKYLSKLPEDAQKKLLGVQGAQAFREDKSTWRNNLKNYSEPSRPKNIIPKNILFGEK